MKKIILFFTGFFFIPCGLVFCFSLFCEELRIGGGGNTLAGRYIGKEILIEINGLYKSMDVEEYVLGVLAGSIPPDYDMEALKVQAVLIRTNVLKEMQEKNTKDAADLSYHYLAVEERRAIWGERNFEDYESRMERAVIKTAGKVVEQENSLIMALYHEVSIGKTASAQEILGEDISYLQSVESSQDVEAKHYMNIVQYTWEEAGSLMGRAVQQPETAQEAPASEGTAEGTEAPAQEAPASEERAEGPEAPVQEGPASEETAEGPETPAQEAPPSEIQPEEQGQSPETAFTGEENGLAIQVEESTENGFVKTLSVDGTTFTGEEAMELFSLSSTNFYAEEIDGGIRFVCLGKGSCLGVSQYGANYMALKGKKMEEIIQYYYTGVSVTDYQ